MAGHGEKLTRKQEQAVAALLAEATLEGAAARVPVALATLKNWLRRPDFQAACRDSRRALLEGAITRLQQIAIKAVLSLARNLECGKPAAEIRAAVAVLEHSWRGLEAFDLEARLAALEAAAARPGKRSSP
jgi:hypothetical protein